MGHKGGVAGRPVGGRDAHGVVVAGTEGVIQYFGFEDPLHHPLDLAKGRRKGGTFEKAPSSLVERRCG